ncbi:MAG TPA: PD-(D/E)XK nuclease family protein [Polyangiaceae bacterium]|nr:PD-(D/E)XK nuclease family protein [Polyangiaceae bacterium]
MTQLIRAEVLVDHLSASQLSTYIRCPKLFSLRYIAKQKPEHQSACLAFGRAWGVTIGEHLQRSEPGALVPLGELTARFRAELERELTETTVPVLFEDGESTDTLVTLASRMLEVFQAEVPLPEAVLGIEVAFSVTLKHPRDPSEEIVVPLVGALDALVVENGAPVIWELKTSRKRYSATELELAMLQPTVYTVGARVLDVEDAEVAVIVATKAKQPAVQISRLRRHETDEIELYELAEQVLRAVAAGVYPRNRGHACVTCAHRTECAP